MFQFTTLSNIIRIRFTVKISFKMSKQERHTDKGSPPTIICLSSFFYLLFSFFSLYKTVGDKYFWNFVSRSQICLRVLNLPEFIIKSNCLLLAAPRDSRNCKKHSEENNLHEREYDIRKDLNLGIVLTKNKMQSFFETQLSKKMQRTCYATKTKETCERERLAYSISELVSLERETKRHLWS